MSIKSTLDLSYLETMSGNDRNTQKLLLEALLKEVKTAGKTARLYCEREEWMPLARFCHHYKSTLSFSGDPRLIDANAALLRIAEADGVAAPGAVERNLVVLERNGQAVIREVQRLLKEYK